MDKELLEQFPALQELEESAVQILAQSARAECQVFGDRADLGADDRSLVWLLFSRKNDTRQDQEKTY